MGKTPDGPYVCRQPAAGPDRQRNCLYLLYCPVRQDLSSYCLAVVRLFCAAGDNPAAQAGAGGNDRAVPHHAIAQDRAGPDLRPAHAAPTLKPHIFPHLRFRVDKPWRGRFRQGEKTGPGAGQQIGVDLQVVRRSADIAPEAAVHPEIADPAALPDQFPVQIDDMKKTAEGDAADDFGFDNLDAGEGETAGPCFGRVRIEGGNHRTLHGNGVEARKVVQGHGHHVAGAPVVPVEGGNIDIMADIAVHDQQRPGGEAGQGLPQAAAGAENLRFGLEQYLGQPADCLLHLAPEMMAVDDDCPAAGCAQHIDQQQQQRSVQHREQRFGTNIRVGAQAGAKAGGQQHGLH